jgi:hypothetical protein
MEGGGGGPSPLRIPSAVQPRAQSVREGLEDHKANVHPQSPLSDLKNLEEVITRQYDGWDMENDALRKICAMN